MNWITQRMTAELSPRLLLGGAVGHRGRRGTGCLRLGVATAAMLAGVIIGLPALAQTSFMGGSMMSMMPGLGGGGGGQGCGEMMRSMGSPGWNGRPNDQWRGRNGRPIAPAPGHQTT